MLIIRFYIELNFLQQSLRDVHSLVDTLLDGLMQETDQTMPVNMCYNSLILPLYAVEFRYL